jgi:hypothetical protein
MRAPAHSLELSGIAMKMIMNVWPASSPSASVDPTNRRLREANPPASVRRMRPAGCGCDQTHGQTSDLP